VIRIATNLSQALWLGPQLRRCFPLSWLCALLPFAAWGNFPATGSLYPPSSVIDIEVDQGHVVAGDASRVVVGSPFADNRAGAAKVHDSNSGGLIQVLHAPVMAKDNQFGASLAISGNTVAVGAPGEVAPDGRTGAVHIYNLQSATPGSPVLTITAPGPVADIQFGRSVALEGTRLVIGASHSDVASTGSVHVFELGLPNPGQAVHQLFNPSASPGDGFGTSVALEGDRIAVSAPGKDSGAGRVLIYELDSGDPVNPAITIPPPVPVPCGHFGFALALDGDLLVASALHDGSGEIDDGFVHGFDLSGGTGATLEFTFTAPAPASRSQFGYSLALAEGLLLVGSPGSPGGSQSGPARGSACVFDLTGPNPSIPSVILNHPTGDACVGFGSGLTLAAGRAIVGAPYAGNAMNHLGRAYIFNPSSTVAPEDPTASVRQSVQAQETHFGSVVAMEQHLMAIGAPYDDLAGEDAGAVYLYDQTTGQPATPMAILFSPEPSPYNHFGAAIDISGNLIVIGVPQNDMGAQNAGRAYVFNLAGGAPVLVATLNNPAPAPDDTFGGSVAISGHRVLIGAHRDDASRTDSGTAYLYDLLSATPSIPTAVVINPDPDIGDYFGASVAISGNRIAIGAPLEDSIDGDAGQVYLYNLPASGIPALLGSVSHPLAESDDLFGASISLDGGYLAVGAFGDDTDPEGDTDGSTGSRTGSAMVFNVSGAAASLVTMLNSPGELDNAGYGAAVAVDGTRVLIGALGRPPGATSPGVVYAYDMSSPTPAAPVAVLRNPAGTGSSAFGSSVSISAKRIVIGAPTSDHSGPKQGAAHLFEPYAASISLELLGSHLAPGGAVEMGVAALGTSKTLHLKINNAGNGALTVSAPQWGGSGAASFSSSPAGSISVPPFGNRLVPISFAPSSLTATSATLTLASDSTLNPVFMLVFSGLGSTRELLYANWTSSAGLTNNRALPEATPHGEGVENILKYAFNLNGSAPDLRVLTAGNGLSGLPIFSRTSSGNQVFFRLEYLRRKGSGLQYVAKTSPALGAASFAPMGGSETVIDIDSTWERVIMQEAIDPALSPKRFGVVEVTFP
jgi:hypothetical protein